MCASDQMCILPNPTQATTNIEVEDIEESKESDLNTEDDFPDCPFNLGEVSIFMEEETADDKINQETESEEISSEFVKFDPYESDSDDSVVTIVYRPVEKSDNSWSEEDDETLDFNDAPVNVEE
ncbi:unnamed protein product [Rodentolepis nana]|uniref:Iwr1 domain-containing protein n=1 Tax=Rodentolepis nana TaxID=102285 RepID=A0A0R3TJS9_RODNA|nr:unnamed protein product [Rodentolepis nana]